MMKLTIILTFATLTLVSCSKITPAGFWTDFDKNLQIEHINDQGPWGGHRAIHWTADNKETFNTKRIIDFATKNGWTLVDSTQHSTRNLIKWKYMNNPIFPLSHTGFSPTVIPSNSVYENFPRWTSSDAMVFHFETGWVSIQPGTDDSNLTNGFVMVNKDQNEMTVYHLWGE
ncbi:hypothetical protein [Xanthovirga aplysinae]|uniref:hypothetical protein n=1 Tax=Xanthovirga aplysinae TaxID=2529853 RepID=UPI0012BB81EA|nr:hypothetical protein [Xanthovirga aplysinae]MTI29276.1 hypothetical protein [Xanthovirga aplysinae]